MTTQRVAVSPDRTPHWIKLNHQNRVPSRWVAFDTESRSERNGDEEIQTWGMGAAIRWRTDLKTGDHAEAATFDSPDELWRFVSDHCVAGVRTIVAAHNLGHDVRISQALAILPTLGYQLEWCNLDRNVSSMTWRSDHGTIVFMDTWTWLPMDLATIAPSVGLRKLQMPPDNAKHHRWERYCMRDAEIVYRCVSQLMTYIKTHDLGNWQPTGAGMAYATWRHKFMLDKILVHDDVDALSAEREAMHTGRAEAWRHGEVDSGLWTEVDMRNAYTMIAAECELPVKLKMHTGAITNDQYISLGTVYARLCQCDVVTSTPCVPYNSGHGILWPVGRFTTWLWDTEIDSATRSGATISIRQCFCYTRANILGDWARWVLGILGSDGNDTPAVVRTWLKHCARALIGRISLRSPSWELFGDNPAGDIGITWYTDAETGQTARMMHVGNRTFVETERVEGRDSLPQVTGWIMAECRVRLWGAMRVAGLDQVAHVDTDAALVSAAGLARLKTAYGASWATHWAVKGTWRRLVVYGPRNYRAGTLRKTAGVPRKAVEVLPNVFHGERWRGMATDLEHGHFAAVTVLSDKWNLKRKDPRRLDAPGAGTATIAVQVDGGASDTASSSPKSAVGE